MKKYIIGWIAVKLVLLAAFIFYLSGYNATQLAQTAKSPTPTDDKIERPTSNPYTGDLARFDRENRAERLQINRVMDLLGIKEGSSVADIGAGGGWFTVIAARRVGSDGKVYAVDINTESKTFIDSRAQKEGLTNVKTVTSTPDDPLLPKEAIDAVLILNTYHEVSEPIVLMKNLRKSLRKNALVGIIDRNGKGDDHGIDLSEVIKETQRAGFRFKESHSFVSAGRMDYFAIFELAPENPKEK